MFKIKLNFKVWQFKLIKALNYCVNKSNTNRFITRCVPGNIAWSLSTGHACEVGEMTKCNIRGTDLKTGNIVFFARIYFQLSEEERNCVNSHEI